MAQPITWQNVNGPNLADALRPFQAAQGSLNSAFSGLGDILKERSAIEAANAAQLKQNNTQSFLDQVAQLGQTPEQLQAALQSGQVNQLRASYGNDIDKAATRNAGESLLADRYKQVQAATEFGNTMLNEKTAPVMDRFKKASILQDAKGMEEARAEYTALGGKHGADLESFAQNTVRDNMKYDETKKGWVRDEAKHLADLTHMKNQDANAAAQTAIAGRNAAVNEAELKIRGEEIGFKREDRAEERIAKVGTALGALGSKSAASLDGTQAIFKAINDNYKDPATQNNARLAAAEILKADPSATTAAVMAGVLSMGETSWRPWDWKVGRRADAKATAKSQGSSKESLAEQGRTDAREAVLLEQLNRARADLEKLRAGGNSAVKNPFE